MSYIDAKRNGRCNGRGKHINISCPTLSNKSEDVGMHKPEKQKIFIASGQQQLDTNNGNIKVI